MKREEMQDRLQDVFFELAPDILDEIMDAVEKPVDNVVIDMSDSKKTNRYKRSFAVSLISKVAIFVMILGLGFGIFGLKNNQCVYIMAIDVNPSIQMEMDQEYYVQRITGLNDDGKNIIKKMNFKKNTPLAEMVETIMDQFVSEGYLQENSGILFTLMKEEEIQDCEGLKKLLHQEIEKDIGRCGISGVKIAFQETGKSAEQTGKDILKEQIREKYHLDDKKIDAMNIRDMIDYVEEEKTGEKILDNVVKEDEKNTITQSNIPEPTAIAKESTHPQEERKEKSSKEKIPENKEKKRNSDVVTEESKKEQETSEKSSVEAKKEQKKTTTEESKSNPEKSLQRENKGSQMQEETGNDKARQEKHPESETIKGAEKPLPSASVNSEEKHSDITNPDSSGKETKPEDKTETGRVPEPTDKGNHGTWQDWNNQNGSPMWPAPNHGMEQGRWPATNDGGASSMWPAPNRGYDRKLWSDGRDGHR
ncbi:MAG: hypothetical protein ACI4SQ_03605 [Eubacterium sp.]